MLQRDATTRGARVPRRRDNTKPPRTRPLATLITPGVTPSTLSGDGGGGLAPWGRRGRQRRSRGHEQPVVGEGTTRAGSGAPDPGVACHRYPQDGGARIVAGSLAQGGGKQGWWSSRNLRDANRWCKGGKRRAKSRIREGRGAVMNGSRPTPPIGEPPAGILPRAPGGSGAGTGRAPISSWATPGGTWRAGLVV